MPDFQCPVNTSALQYPKAKALEWSAGALGYAELDALILEVQERLYAAGISAFDRIAVSLPNSWQYVVLIHALFRTKSVVVPLSTRFPEVTVNQLLANLGCKALVLDKDSLLKAEHQFPEKQYLVEDLVPDIAPMNVSRVSTHEQSIIDSNQHATILFSSGSTGLPKAILHSWGNHYYSALGSNENIVLARGDRWLLSLPLYHVAGMAVLFRCFVAGATVVLPPQNSTLLQALQTRKISHVSLVSTQLQRLLETSGDNSPDYLKSVLLGGSAFSRPLLRRAYSSGWPIYTSYGMTEMSSQITATSPDADLAILFTSGSVLPYRKVKLGEGGQIFVKGKTCFLGYVTASGIEYPFEKDEWYDTGDLGRMDDKGCLHVLGRKDNMFISGGENIHPEEIERTLELYAGVKRAIVVPLPDKEFGFRSVAFIDYEGPKPDKTLIERHLKGKIARFMNPVAYFDLTVEDEQLSMKIPRKTLQEKAKKKLVL